MPLLKTKENRATFHHMTVLGLLSFDLPNRSNKKTVAILCVISIAAVSKVSRLCTYLLQHEEPSSGCAQQAPLFSSGLLLGVQQVVADFDTGVQHEDADPALPVVISFVFSRTGMFVISVSILKYLPI